MTENSIRRHGERSEAIQLPVRDWIAAPLRGSQ